MVTSGTSIEAIDGRTAEVYDVDMAKADPAVLAGVQGFIGKGVTRAAGKVWVDRETGGLLKANLDLERRQRARHPKRGGPWRGPL